MFDLDLQPLPADSVPGGRQWGAVPPDRLVLRCDADSLDPASGSRRAALVAAPFIVGIVFLLRAGDVVFAEFLAPDIALGPIAEHGTLVTLFVVGIIALRSSTGLTAVDIDHPGTFGVLEVLTMLGLGASVLVLFVASQLVAVTSVGDRLVRATGMRPAQYARSGFFQLGWATLAIVVLLVLIRRLATPLALSDTWAACDAATPFTADVASTPSPV